MKTSSFSSKSLSKLEDIKNSQSYARLKVMMDKNKPYEKLNQSFDSDASNYSNRSILGNGGDMFTGGEVKTKGKPVKGYRIMLFTLFMMIFLTSKVSYDRFHP